MLPIKVILLGFDEVYKAINVQFTIIDCKTDLYRLTIKMSLYEKWCKVNEVCII